MPRRFGSGYALSTLVFGLTVASSACVGHVSEPGAGAGSGGSGNPGSGGSGNPGSGSTSGGSGSGSSSGSASGGAGSGGTPGSGGDPGLDDVAAACAASNNALDAGLTPARRLTRVEYSNSVRDLIGGSGTTIDALGDDERIGPFNSNAIAPITELLVQQYSEVAAALAVDAKSRLTQISPCDLTADKTTRCATSFVTTFGQRAYRRPLTGAEVTQYVNLYTIGQQAPEGAPNGFRLVVEAMLQSPFFLYHYDVGGTGTPQAGTVAITPWELASRLSYFLWNSMPDDTLFAAAQDGSLMKEATISAQVARMLNDSRAAGTIALFHRQWLDITDLPDQPKDPTMFPQYDAALTDAMMQETALFTDYVIRKGDGLLKTLLTSNMAFPQGGLFDVYGVKQPAGYTVGTPVMLDPTQRAGILTQAAFLTRWAHNNQTSPVHRGKLIRLNVLCGNIPPPPANVNTTPPVPTAATSTRERFAQHSSDPTCAGCHKLMDPIGLGFENYDPIGAYRTMDGLGPVDATGTINSAGPDLAGDFDGAIDLANKLAASQDVSNCFAAQWFRFSLGRMETTDDACSIQGIRDAFRASGGDIRDLLGRIALSPAFRNVRLDGG
ncbi:MAG TPA: DUF1592 domain-containing protein [Polyangia bacterium]|jgi:hypothetical protein